MLERRKYIQKNTGIEKYLHQADHDGDRTQLGMLDFYYHGMCTI